MGYGFDNVSQAVEAIIHIDAIDRRLCAAFARNLSADNFIEGIESMFGRLIENTKR